MTSGHLRLHDGSMTVSQVGSTPGSAESVRERFGVRWRSFLGWRAFHITLTIVSIAAAVLGVVLFDAYPHGTDDELMVYGLLPWALAFTIAGAVLLGYPKARAVGTLLLLSGSLGAFSILLTGVSLTLRTQGLWTVDTVLN